MLTRFLLRLLLLVGLAMPLSAFSLGVGPLQVRSALYQNLEAEIPLVVSNPAELIGLKVQIPRQQVFDQMGVERLAFFANLRFAVQSLPGGAGVIKVTSTQPIRDPNFDLLIEAVWPRGRLLRTFPVQIDPELYAHRQQPAPPIIEPQTLAPAAVAELAPAPTTPSPPPAPDVSFEGASTYGPVRRGENLTQIARQVRPSDAISIQRMKEILVAGNPEAFSRGNPNTLRVGATLRVPTASALGVEATAPTPAVAVLTPPQSTDSVPSEAPLAPPPAPTPEPAAETPTAPVMPVAEVAPAPTPEPAAETPTAPIAPVAEVVPAPTPEPAAETPSAALPPSIEPMPVLPAPQEILPQATLPQPTPEPTPSPAPPVTETPVTPEPPAATAPVTPEPVAETPAPAVATPPEADTSWFSNPVVWIAMALIALAVGAVVLLPMLRRPARRSAAVDVDVEAPPAEPETLAGEEEADAPQDDLARTRIEMLRNRRSKRAATDVPEDDAAAPPLTTAAPAKPAPKAPTSAAPPKPIDELLKNIDFNLGAAADISVPKVGSAGEQRMPDAEPPTASVTKAKAVVPPPMPRVPAPLPVVEPKAPSPPPVDPPSELPSGLQFDKMDFDLSELGLDTPRQANELPPLELKPVTAAPPPANKTDEDWGALDFDIPAFASSPPPAAEGAFTLNLPERQTAPERSPEPAPAPNLKFEFNDVSQNHAAGEPLSLLDADLQNFGGGLGVDEATLDLAAPAAAGTDYIETKLDLAAAYLDMGDQVGARGLLEDVVHEGDAAQKERAAALLKKLN